MYNMQHIYLPQHEIYPMDWQGVILRGKRPNKKTVPFSNSLRFNNNHLYKKTPNIKVVFLKISNFSTMSITYKCHFKNRYMLYREKNFWYAAKLFTPALPIRGILYGRQLPNHDKIQHLK